MPHSCTCSSRGECTAVMRDATSRKSSLFNLIFGLMAPLPFLYNSCAAVAHFFPLPSVQGPPSSLPAPLCCCCFLQHYLLLGGPSCLPPPPFTPASPMAPAVSSPHPHSPSTLNPSICVTELGRQARWPLLPRPPSSATAWDRLRSCPILPFCGQDLHK